MLLRLNSYFYYVVQKLNEIIRRTAGLEPGTSNLRVSVLNITPKMSSILLARILIQTHKLMIRIKRPSWCSGQHANLDRQLSHVRTPEQAKQFIQLTKTHNDCVNNIYINITALVFMNLVIRCTRLTIHYVNSISCLMPVTA